MGAPNDWKFFGAQTGTKNAAVPKDQIQRLVGVLVSETAGAAGPFEITFYQGATVAGGTKIATLAGKGDSTADKFFGVDGLRMRDGISFQVTDGTVDATIVYKDG